MYIRVARNPALLIQKKPSNLEPQTLNFISSSLLLSSLELSDIKVYGPWIRALLGTTSHICEGVQPSTLILNPVHHRLLLLRSFTRPYSIHRNAFLLTLYVVSMWIFTVRNIVYTVYSDGTHIHKYNIHVYYRNSIHVRGSQAGAAARKQPKSQTINPKLTRKENPIQAFLAMEFTTRIL